MGETKASAIFTSLPHLMDETVQKENSLMDSLYDFQIVVDEKLIPAIEKIQYENKYELIDRIRDLCRDISLYLHFPEMVNRVLVGFYCPDDLACKVIYENFIKDFIDSGNDNIPFKNALSETVPALIHADPDYPMIRALNLAENTISLSNKEYIELIKDSLNEGIDLAGLVYGISIPSQNMKNEQVYLTIPKGVDIHKKYYISFVNAVDILVLHARECQEKLLKKYRNISRIFIYGKLSGKDTLGVKKYCKEKGISLKSFNSLSEIIEQLKDNKYMRKTQNFCYIYYLENILYEISWYLSVKKSEQEHPLADINDNLLYKDEESYQCVKELQSRYSKKIQHIMALYSDYKNICDILTEKIRVLQDGFGVKESVDCVNQHIKMNDILLELILKMSETYKGFPTSAGKERMREYCDIYKRISDQSQVSNVILDDFLGCRQTQDDLSDFCRMQSKSVFFKRKKLDLRDRLSLNINECAEIILSLKVPLRSEEKRILGEYYLSQGKTEQAKKYLEEALEEGDREAGEIMVNSLEVSSQELGKIADYGVKTAAYRVGKNLYSNSGYMDESKKIANSLKYLHIAAAQKHLKAIKLLGDIYYEEYNAQDDMKDAQKALHYYQVAEKNGSIDSRMAERIGDLYYKQGSYKNAIEALKKADTANSYYILGRIYANGYGCAVNKYMALHYYKKAAGENHFEAQVAYNRLREEIAASQKKNVIRENKSYSSSSYTSNYSSSSGW